MITNQLLCRHRDGYDLFYRSSSILTWGVREGFVSLAQMTQAQAEQHCEQLLDEMAEPATSYRSSMFARVGQAPFIDFNVGDTITVPTEAGTEAMRVLALSVVQQDDGSLRFVPEVNHVQRRGTVEAAVERHEQWLQSMVAGSLGGTVKAATLVANSPTAAAKPSGTVIPTTISGASDGSDFVFHKSGALAAGVSDPYPVRQDRTFTDWVASLKVAGTTATTVTLYKNGVAVDTLTIPIGALTASKVIAVAAVRLNRMTQDVTAVGTGANGLVSIVGS